MYPHVLGEVETLREVCAGRSLARYGDGEFALCRGVGIKCQRADAALKGRLQGILEAAGHCLVGIPNIHSETPKATYWAKYIVAAGLLTDRPYVSSFVSRPDSAPWIDTPAYWQQIESLWRGVAVTLVRGSARSLTAADLIGAAHVTEIIAADHDAWRDHASLFERVRLSKPNRVLLCLGPTATVLAVDLSAHGKHAIDLGHLGLFLRKYRRGEPMTVTKADKEMAA